MGNRSGRRLTNSQKKANRKERKKRAAKNRPKYLNHHVPQGYFETFSALKEHVREFLAERKIPGERWSTLSSKDAVTRSVIVLIGKNASVDVKRIKFDGDNVTVLISIWQLRKRHPLRLDWPGVRPYENREAHRGEATWALGDPNMVDGLNVLLTEAYEFYQKHEYPDSSNA